MNVRMRVRVSFDPGRGYFVNLPVYSMIEGSWRPVTDKLLHKNGAVPGADPARVIDLSPTVEVEVPEYHTDGAGRLDKKRIRTLYHGQEAWDHDKVTDDLIP